MEDPIRITIELLAPLRDQVLRNKAIWEEKQRVQMDLMEAVEDKHLEEREELCVARQDQREQKDLVVPLAVAAVAVVGGEVVVQEVIIQCQENLDQEEEVVLILII